MKILTRIKILALSLAASVMLAGCHSIDEPDNTVMGNFDALWTLVDEHYCFFEQKGIDWAAVYDKYAPSARNCRTATQLFDVCARMLDELCDGHVNLSAPFNTSYYRRWWSDYPQNYDERLVEQYYLGMDWNTAGALRYKTLKENVGYVRYASFANTLGEGNLDAVLSSLVLCKGLIIDVRDNSGGDMSNVERFVRRFITARTLAGYISHKTGKGHGDMSKPYAYYYEPLAGRPVWTKPVVVLCNRSTFSAANNFVSVMKSLSQVIIVGDRSGGGSGMPLSAELPCGWSVRMSACSVLDPDGASTENGVEPTAGYAVDLDTEAAAGGTDTMIEAAIRAINSSPASQTASPQNFTSHPKQ